MNQRTTEFAQRAIDHIQKAVPVQSGNKIFTLENLKFVPPSTLNDIGEQRKMRYSGQGSVVGKIRGNIVLKNADTGDEVDRSPTLDLLPVYAITDRGAYVVNGVDKVIRSSMRRKPGVYTGRSNTSATIKTEIAFDHKAGAKAPRFILTYNPTTNSFVISVKRGNDKNYNGIDFLRGIGASDPQIASAIGNNSMSDILFQMAKGSLDPGTLYQAITGEQPRSASPDSIRADLMEYLGQNATFGSGSDTLEFTIGRSANALDVQVFLDAVRKLFLVAKDEAEEDGEDLRFKEVLSDNDLLLEQLDNDLVVLREEAFKKLESLNDDQLAYTQFNAARKLGTSIDNFMRGGTSGAQGETSLVVSPEGINPLFMASVGRQISQVGGEGGIKAAGKNNATAQRNLKGLGINRLDPVETPESGNVGLVERLSQSAEIKNGTIYAKKLRVTGKEISAGAANTVELTPEQEYKATVAYFDPEYVERRGNKIVFTKNTVLARRQGKDVTVPLSEVQYLDTAAQDIFSYPANMIPFVNHDDGNRALMGTNMQRDALPLKYREVPLVSTSVNGTNQTYEKLIGEEFGRPVRSKVEGVVERITDDTITVKDADNNIHAHPYYKHFRTTQGSINNELKVKVGDRVKANDLLAEGWQTVNGTLALGRNARTGYLAYKGYNYEDGVVISQSFAEKMTVEEVEDIEVLIPEDGVGGVGSNALTQLSAYTTKASVFSKLDKDGIIKKGETVKPGDVLVGKLKPRRNKVSSLDSFLRKAKTKDLIYDPYVIPSTSYVEGRVEQVISVPKPQPGYKEKVIVSIVSTKPMKLGDKISGKHGNKGTITKILSDEEMPASEDGQPLEVLFSPLAIPSRKNVGQVLEVGAGLIAEKTGKPIVVNNFDRNEAEKVKEGLKEIGVPDGKMQVYLKEKQEDGSILEVPTENPVTVGNMYVLRLNKQVDDKIQARSNYEGKAPNEITLMPSKEVGLASGEKHNPQSIGEMEFRALQAHGAAYNILESATIKSDGGGDRKQRLAIFGALKSGNLSDLDFPATPGSLKVVADTLKGFNLNLQPLNEKKKANSFDDTFNALALTPIKSSELLKTIGAENEVTTAIPLRAKAGGDDVPLKGGLLDPEIFGERGTLDSRQKWGYIDLATPMPNPILLNSASYDPYSTLTGFNRKAIKSMMEGQSVMISDPDTYNGDLLPKEKAARAEAITQIKASMEAAGVKAGDLISPAELAKLEEQYGTLLWQAGGEALASRLDQIDVKKELRRTERELKDASGADVDLLYKKYKTLDALQKNGLSASDLMLTAVPVTPVYMRQINVVGGNAVSPDINVLYNNLIQANNPIKGTGAKNLDFVSDSTPESAARSTKNIFKNLEHVFGTNQYVDQKRGQEYKGLKQQLSGKSGLIRGNLLRKRVDFSGRGVIGVDPNLELNEVGIPIDMATTIYKPFIFKELMARGYATNRDEAEAKIKNVDSHVREVLKDIGEDRPVIINRQPSLHAQSILALKPVVKDTQDGDVVRNIQLNPLIVTGFNADFDGDQMAVHVPITEKARQEAKDIMMPTENMISNTNGKMIFKIRQEMVMGIYYLTKDATNPVGQPINYSSYSKLRSDWWSGKISTTQAVNIKGMTTTAGYALFILLLPSEYQVPGWGGGESYGPWDNKKIDALFTAMYDQCERTGGKAISKTKIASIMDSVKKLGFDASTKSGLSIGLNDFKKIDNVDKLYDEALDEVKKQDSNMPLNKALDPKVQAAIEVGDKLDQKIKAGEVLEKDNPVDIIFRSGARGKSDQYRKIFGTIGIGADITGKLTQPVKSSFVDGLKPNEYWTLGADSRKGVYDRSVASAEPGAFTRDVWSATQDMVIKEADCGTTDGIDMDKSDTGLAGRTAIKNVVDVNGNVIVRANQTITKEMASIIYMDESITTVRVRSPLRCKTVKGICQKCYGTNPGSAKLVDIGSAVGVIASQAFGEPFTQGTLNTFHSGGAKSYASKGLPRVKKILNLTKDEENSAVLSKATGTVTRIEEGGDYSYDVVYVGNKAHNVPRRGQPTSAVRVKVGDKVIKGDFLTVGNLEDIKSGRDNLTNVNPNEFFDFRRQEIGGEAARAETQELLYGTLNNAVKDSLGSGAIDSRHLELVVGKLTSKVKVTDGGGSNFIKGDTVDKNVADAWNNENSNPYSRAKVSIGDRSAVIGQMAKETYKKGGTVIVKKGEEITSQVYDELLRAGILQVRVQPMPIHYEPLLESKQTVVNAGGKDFFGRLGTRDIGEQIARGAVYGEVDPLSDPRSRIMTGKLPLIGTAANASRSFADAIATSARNLFKK